MTRRLLLASGLLTLAAVWAGPLPDIAPHRFSAHMLMHMGVVAVAAPLLAFGLAGSSYDPVRRHARLFRPIPASVVELIAVWAWHAPAAHHAARQSASGLALEQGTFLAAGFVVWMASCGGGTGGPPLRAAAGVVALLLTSMHMTLLGALLALSPRALYAHAATGTSALDEQHLGGAIMLLVGGISYLAGGLWLSAALLLPGVKPRGECG